MVKNKNLIKKIKDLVNNFNQKKKSRRLEEEKKAKEKQIQDFPPIKVLETQEGNYEKWSEKIGDSDSQIGIIIGARGVGKTALGIKFLEDIHLKNKNKRIFAMGFNPKTLPSWIKVIEKSSEIENNSWVLIDEGGILFNSRNSMSNSNKMLSELILIARHKNLNVLFISQNSSNLEINILRQADFLFLKPSSLLQKEFERKIIQKIYNETEKKFREYDSDKGLTYVYASYFRGFISNPLPSFWKEKISKSFK